MFEPYFKLGWHHIVSISAVDHLLFLMALVALYNWRQWQRLLVLVTAFTLGHSFTLVLSTLGWFSLPTLWIEFCIPLTICATALFNLVQKQPPKSLWFTYAMAFCFGAIHGLGFANALRSLLGKNDNLVWPLLGFNLGVELGQLWIMACWLLLTGLIIQVFRVRQRDWLIFLSGGAFFAATIMVLERWPT